jgi:hypothetical protein
VFREQSALQQLVAILSIGHAGRCYVSVYGSFFDAAGSQDDGKAAIFVSGFVSTKGRWDRFQACWIELLKKHGIAKPFHMSEFACGHGQYASWREDKARRQDFLTKAIDITLRNVLWSFSSGILLADYDRVNQEYRLSEARGEPYAMCAIGTTQRMITWMEKRDIERCVAIYEDGDNGRGDFIERYRAVTGHSPHMAKKGEFAPMEAADMLAYEHAKLVRDKETGRAKSRDDVRVPFRRFEADGRISWGYHNEGSLRELVAANGIPRR